MSDMKRREFITLLGSAAASCGARAAAVASARVSQPGIGWSVSASRCRLPPGLANVRIPAGTYKVIDSDVASWTGLIWVSSLASLGKLKSLRLRLLSEKVSTTATDGNSDPANEPEGAPPVAAMTATCRRTNSAASAGSRSYWPSAQRCSIAGIASHPAKPPAPRGLLRAHGNRPRRRAAEQRDELAAFQVEHPASSPGAAAQKLRLTAQQLQRF
jgi:hypothetical protein